MKKLLKIILFVLLIPIVIFAIFLIYSTVKNYQPANIVPIAKLKGKVIDIRDTLNVFNWNIGYSGLGDDMSFFYDGGEKTRTTEQRTTENLNAIINQIKSHDSVDFYLLQEVDLDSRRSYNLNQFDSITEHLPNYSKFFAFNYKVDFVPVPLNDPLGKTRSGLASFTKHEPFSVVRSAFKGNYSWPMGVFMLDRCYMVQRFFTSNGKELLIINTHNSAYDDGSLRKEQMKLMREFLLAEYSKGNYIVVGGDWNQMPPNDTVSSKEYNDKHLTRLRIDSDFMSIGWSWVFTEEIPSNRMINEGYNKETTVVSTIDFFLLSPNLKGTAFKAIDLQFKNSDHQPMVMTFAFKN